MPNFSEMPAPIKAAVFVGSGGSMLGGIGILATSGETRSLLILVGLALILCAVVLVIYALFLLKQRRHRAEELSDDLGKPRSGSAKDSNEINRLEDLRKKFLDGVRNYRKEGYELYEMPWFAIMGEPGSGKTFALKKSNIGFLPGLQNELQGGGGTYTVDWWFTREAVLLDTAGRFSQEDASQETNKSELAELLRLLRKHRRNCPLNGMILVIPSESLLSDDAEGIEKKAKRLAGTIHRVQRELDVRFPIIIWITKSDRIPGFRAYFDGISNPERQHQMLGWSNPAELDATFDPNQVTQYLSGVTEGLKQRRWSLLEEQKTHGSARPLDSVDSLFSFPEEFSKLLPSLQRYLDLIFVGSRKPPFLRGIYFNSAITEGKEVDRQIAEAMGIPIEEYKAQGGGFTRDKAYFIRDSLTKKLFIEKNLVTRASKAMSSLRLRQWLLVGGVAAGVFAMVVWAWFAHNELKNKIGSESEHWQYFAGRIGGETLDAIKLIDAGAEGSGNYAYRGTRPLGELNGLKPNSTNYLDYYWNLSKFAGQKIPVSHIFNLFAGNRDLGTESRLRAWRIAFKLGILQPVVAATGDKLVHLPNWLGGPEENALLAMLRWEGEVRQGTNFTPALLCSTNQGGDSFLGPMILFLAGGDQVPASFAADHQGRLDVLLWQGLELDPARGSLGKLPSVSYDDVEVLDANHPAGPVGKSLAAFLASAKSRQLQIQNRADAFTGVVAKLNELKNNEEALLSLFQNSAPDGDPANPVVAVKFYETLGTQYRDYQISWQKAREAARLDGVGPLGELAPVLDRLLQDGQTDISKPFDRLLTELTRLHQRLPDVNLYTNANEEIQGALHDSIKVLTNSIAQLKSQAQPFDRDNYSSGPGGVAKVDGRFRLYSQALKLFKTSPPDWNREGENPLQSAVQQQTAFLQDWEKWPITPSPIITLDERFKNNLKVLADSALSYQTNYYVRQFSAHVDAQLKTNLAFPYVYEKDGTVLSFQQFLDIEGAMKHLLDRATKIFGSDAPAFIPVLNQLKTNTATAQALTQVLTNGETVVRTLLIEVPNHAQGEGIEKYLNGQKPAGDSFAMLRFNQMTSESMFVFTTNKPWAVPLNGQGLVLECSPQASPQAPVDWKPLKSMNGEWSPLRFLLENSEELAAEPGKYLVRLRAPDDTYFILKLSLEGGQLPFKTLKAWPRPE